MTGHILKTKKKLICEKKSNNWIILLKNGTPMLQTLFMVLELTRL